MDESRLQTLLDRFDDLKLLVVGDFFLDKYLILDRALSEISLETGLEAYQVVDVQCSPGAAGSVTSKALALGAQVATVGVTGDDGEGYELRRALTTLGADLTPMIEEPEVLTPTYIKPMMREPDGRVRELNRLDIKNRQPLPGLLGVSILVRVHALISEVDGVIIADQVTEPNCGVISDRVREKLESLVLQHPDVTFIVDSRARIGSFHNTLIKPNAREAASAVHGTVSGPIDLEMAREAGQTLFDRNQQPVFVTVGDQGILVFSEEGAAHVPAAPVTGEIDVVGAGDSVMAGLTAALCSGASPEEAALIGNLVAAVTIQQIGTTGTASRQQVLAQYRRTRDTWTS